MHVKQQHPTDINYLKCLLSYQPNFIKISHNKVEFVFFIAKLVRKIHAAKKKNKAEQHPQKIVFDTTFT